MKPVHSRRRVGRQHQPIRGSPEPGSPHPQLAGGLGFRVCGLGLVGNEGIWLFLVLVTDSQLATSKTNAYMYMYRGYIIQTPSIPLKNPYSGHLHTPT